MVQDFYNLREQPFGTTPDASFLFSSDTHREALASLLYGIREGCGFIALIASPGMGKTTLLFRTLDQMKSSARTVFLFQAIATPIDFLRTFLNDLGVENEPGGLVELQAKLTQVLLEQAQRGERLVVVIDEAQNLDNSVLELVRMLSNFETSKDKLMQIILSGQPQLASKLASPELLQLRQRISIVAHLKPLSLEETTLYINHRLKIAGYCLDEPLFTAAALKLITEHSNGIPRNINNLCFNAMSIGCALKKRTIDKDIIREVIADFDLGALTAMVDSHGKKDSAIQELELAKPVRRMWMPRAALMTAVLLVLSAKPETEGRVIAKAHAIYAKATPIEESVVNEDQGAIASKPGGGTVSSPEMAAATPTEPSQPGRPIAAETSSSPKDRIVVTPGMTFSQLCAEAFATTCHTKEFDAIRRLNPWLFNANSISAGGVLSIPQHQDLSKDATVSNLSPSAIHAKEVLSQ
jgi:general secretion pathway protein A